jgi:O-antigen/teichoic acid export membrane protein
MSAPTGSLKQRVLRAGSWTAGGFAVSQTLRIVSTLIMTRLLAPEMFGLMSIAVMVNVITALLTDLGITQNIVQSRRGEDPTFLNTAWTVQIVRGFIVWGLALVVAIAIYFGGREGLLSPDTVYGNPVLPWVLAVSSFSIVIASFASTNTAIAERHFNQRHLIRIDLTSQIVSLVAMVVLGLWTGSIWSLIAGQLAGGVCGTTLSHLILPGERNRFGWDPKALGEIVAFGKWVFFSSFVGVFALYADRLVLGGLVQASVLGQFAIASTIVGAVQGVFQKLYATVVMPALSETARNDRPRLREVFYRLRVPTDLALLFVAGVLAASGKLVIGILYDHRYGDAGWMLQILALSLVWVRYGASQQLYVALGEPKYVAFLNFARSFAVFAALFVGFRLGGVAGAIWAFSLHQIVNGLMTYYFNASLKLNDFKRELLVLVALPVGYGVGLCINLLRPT